MMGFYKNLQKSIKVNESYDIPWYFLCKINHFCSLSFNCDAIAIVDFSQFCSDNFKIVNFCTCLSWKLKIPISQILTIVSHPRRPRQVYPILLLSSLFPGNENSHFNFRNLPDRFSEAAPRHPGGRGGPVQPDHHHPEHPDGQQRRKEALLQLNPTPSMLTWRRDLR